MELKLNIVAIVQARLNSTRLPGKVIKKVDGISLIEILIYRLRKSKMLSKVVVATTDMETDDELCALLKSKKIDFFSFYYSTNSTIMLSKLLNFTLSFKGNNML